jgi:hypothetical protein
VDLTGGWFETRKAQFERAQLDTQQASEAAAAAKQEAAVARGAKGQTASEAPDTAPGSTTSAGGAASRSSRATASSGGATPPPAAAADGLYTENELKKRAVLKSQLQAIAARLGVSLPDKVTKTDLITAILQHQKQHGLLQQLEEQPAQELQYEVQELQQQQPAQELQYEVQELQQQPAQELQYEVQKLQQQPAALLGVEPLLQDEPLQQQLLQAPAVAAEPAGAGSPEQQWRAAAAAPAPSRPQRQSLSASRQPLSTAEAQQLGLPEDLHLLGREELLDLPISACFDWMNSKVPTNEVQELVVAAAQARAAGASFVMTDRVLTGILARGLSSTRNVNKQQLLACLQHLDQPHEDEQASLPNAVLLELIQKALDSRDAASSSAVGSSSCSSDSVLDAPDDSSSSSSRGSSGPTVAAAGFSMELSSSSSVSSVGSVITDGFDISGSSSSSPRPRRSRTGSSTASKGWSPPRRGGLAVSGVLGSSAELAPPSVEELRSDPTAAGILSEFERFFCSDVPKKVWHNYGFDRHVLEGLFGKDAAGRQKKLAGFDGDTLHLSRLHDASRKTKGGYGLEALSSDAQVGWRQLGGTGLLPGGRGAASLRQSCCRWCSELASVPDI